MPHQVPFLLLVWLGLSVGEAAQCSVDPSDSRCERTVAAKVPPVLLQVPPILLQSGASLEQKTAMPEVDDEARETHKLLAVLMRNGGPSSQKRVQSIRSTWAQDLEEGSLILLEADAGCEAQYGDNHGMGLTCLEAKAHLKLMNRTDFDWLLVVDDDTYVFAERLRDTLLGMDPEKKAVYGIPGCGHCSKGRTGFCGGGGYMLSRKNLLRMAGLEHGPALQASQASFLQSFMSTPDASPECDVRFGCVAQDAGLKPIAVKGLYGWSVKGAHKERRIVELKQDDPPLVLHYISNDSHMQLIRREHLREQKRHADNTTAYTTAQWLTLLQY